MRQLGVKIELDNNNNNNNNYNYTAIIEGAGLRGLHESKKPVDFSNSGTTFRLMSGILSGQHARYILTGDDSLQDRPMDRIMEPLQKMGSKVRSIKRPGYAPIEIQPSLLHGIRYELPIASAQVKSAILLAGLYADSPTTIIEPVPSRNHTELMLASQGTPIDIRKEQITISPASALAPLDMTIPGDISSSAFLLVLATLLPDSVLTIQNVGINPTRTGILTVLKSMGADIKILNEQIIGGEPVADLYVKSARLQAVTIQGDLIPKLIDEIPVIAVAAAFARGTTIIRDAGELRFKETDRIRAICLNLEKMGAEVYEQPDGMLISGGKCLKGARIDSFADHRIAMAFSVAASMAEGNSQILNGSWADISFPGFYKLLDCIRGMQTNG
jgi:3-phosphoshikimate 1-carboxyvinyltransferase